MFPVFLIHILRLLCNCWESGKSPDVFFGGLVLMVFFGGLVPTVFFGGLGANDVLWGVGSHGVL